MTTARSEPFGRALQTVYTWLDTVADEFGTDDRRLALRVLRAWLHTARDRLSVPSAAKLAAQLPELLRGVFYDGWEPSRVPIKYGPDEYVSRFAFEARIRTSEVPMAAATVAVALREHISAGLLAEVLAQVPPDLRGLIGGDELAEVSAGARRRPVSPASQPVAPAEAARVQGAPADGDRLARVEHAVATLTEAVRILAHGLEEYPQAEPDRMRAPHAARRASELLLSAGS